MFHVIRIIQLLGTSFSSKKLGFRILVGTWALGCFLLVNYYNSILTSFFTSPNYQPLIKSVYDLQKKTDIKMVANAISAPVFFFRVIQFVYPVTLILLLTALLFIERRSRNWQVYKGHVERRSQIVV